MILHLQAMLRERPPTPTRHPPHWPDGRVRASVPLRMAIAALAVELLAWHLFLGFVAGARGRRVRRSWQRSSRTYRLDGQRPALHRRPNRPNRWKSELEVYRRARVWNRFPDRVLHDRAPTPRLGARIRRRVLPQQGSKLVRAPYVTSTCGVSVACPMRCTGSGQRRSSAIATTGTRPADKLTGDFNHES